MTEPWQRLMDLAVQSGTLTLVSPYVKSIALHRVLQAVPRTGQARLFMRWQDADFCSGASDVDAYSICRAFGVPIFSVANLHAKYYAAGGSALIGSANLTARGMGLCTNSNIELLISVDSSNPDLGFLLETIGISAVPVSQSMYEQACANIALLPPRELVLSPQPLETQTDWNPRSRNPESALHLLSEDGDTLTTEQVQRIKFDLIDLGVTSPGSDVFESIRSAMRRQSIVNAIVERLDRGPLRFGEIRAITAQHSPATDHTTTTQNIVRWLLYYMPDSVQWSRPGYTEILSRVK